MESGYLPPSSGLKKRHSCDAMYMFHKLFSKTILFGPNFRPMAWVMADWLLFVHNFVKPRSQSEFFGFMFRFLGTAPILCMPRAGGGAGIVWSTLKRVKQMRNAYSHLFVFSTKRTFLVSKEH